MAATLWGRSHAHIFVLLFVVDAVWSLGDIRLAA